jgi:hypothetical protein
MTMTEAGSSPDGPPRSEIESVLTIRDVRREERRIVYEGIPRTPIENLQEYLEPLFRQQGYDLTVRTGPDGFDTPPKVTLIARPQSRFRGGT